MHNANMCGTASHQLTYVAVIVKHLPLSHNIDTHTLTHIPPPFLSKFLNNYINVMPHTAFNAYNFVSSGQIVA